MEPKEILWNNRPANYNLRMVVIVIWKSPMTNAWDCRTAGFDDWTDAMLYAEQLKKQYKALNVKNEVYILSDNGYSII